MADLSMVFDLLAKDRASSEVDKVGDSMRDAGDSADGLGDRVSGMFGKIAGLAAGAGLAVGAAFASSLEAEGATRITTAQLGLDPAQSAAAGELAGTLYAGNYGDSLEDVNTAIGAVASSLESVGPIGSEAMQTATRDALNFAGAFGTDVNEAVGTVGQLITNGLVPDAQSGFDLMTAAYQRVPAAMREELPAILNEYGTNFAALGYNGEQAFAMLTAAADGGAIVLDKTGDALKEFTLLGIDPKNAELMKELGINAEATANAIATGGAPAQAALQETAAALLAMEDPGARANAAIALFGTPMEDLGVSKIPSFLSAISGVGPGMTDAAGAADGLDATLAQGIGPRLETLKRGAQTAATEGVNALLAGFTQGKTDGDGWQGTLQNLASTVSDTFGPALEKVGTFLTDTLLPKLGELAQWMTDNQTTITVLAGVISGVLALAFTVWGTRAIAAAAQNTIAWGSAVLASRTGAATTRLSAMQVVASWALMAVRAVASGIRIAAVWTAQIAASAARGAASAAVAVARVVAGWVLMGAQAMLGALRMAAAWLVAMGPVGWIIAAVIGLAILIAANFDKIKAWIGAAWDWVSEKTSGVWNSIISWVSDKVGSIIDFVKGIPGKIGDMAGALYQKGKDMIQGLIDGAGSLLKSIGSFFLNLLPGWIRGPFEKALGISSPSKVFRKYGVNIGQGLIKGLDGSEKDVKAASKKLGAELVKAFHAALKNSDLASAQKALDAIDVLNRTDDKLIALAKSRDQIAKRLEVARDKLADAVKMRDDFRASVRDNALSFASLTDIKTAGSPRVLVDELQQRLTAITRFRAQLAKLSKMGVSRDVYQQIAEAGVEAGGATADALLTGGPKTIKQINALQSKISGASKGLGADATKKLYQAGVDAAQGLVKGLSQQSKGLAQAADRLARQLTDAVKKRLGIRSPSKVFEGIGTSIGEGLAEGIASMRPVVAAELAALADSQAVQSLQDAVDVDTGVHGAGAVGYTPPAYDTSGVGAAAAGAGSSRTVHVSGVVGPVEVAALVAREQRRDEFLAGAGT
jgi:hypothetical protein